MKIYIYVTGSRKRGNHGNVDKVKSQKKMFGGQFFFIPVYEHTLLCLTSDNILTKIKASKAPSALFKDRHLKSNFFHNA